MNSASRTTVLADRALAFDSSGIRRVFELAAQLKDPVNLSIGQPDFDVPDRVKEACIDAIRRGKNGYSQTQGIAELRDGLLCRVRQEYDHDDRQVFVASGTSGAFVLAMLSVVNPGDEVLLLDPYFVMYRPLVELVGGRPVIVDTYPDFRIDIDRVASSCTLRTKVILFNSPANPTGVVSSEDEIRQLAELCRERGIVLISDEIYRAFCYDQPFVSPARYNEATLVIDGFSKSHGMTGWRLGFAHGPREIVDAMVKLQQYSFVCAPHPVQWAGVVALEVDCHGHVEAYRSKRDRMMEGLAGVYEFARPGGAFYMFPKVPWGDSQQFVAEAVKQGLLLVPGDIFSQRNTHFRISYAAEDATLDRGIEILRSLAESGPS